MSRFTLTIDCDNAAFGDTPQERLAEVARIVIRCGERLETMTEGYPFGTLCDANGNRVGHYALGE